MDRPQIGWIVEASVYAPSEGRIAISIVGVKNEITEIIPAPSKGVTAWNRMTPIKNDAFMRFWAEQSRHRGFLVLDNQAA